MKQPVDNTAFVCIIMYFYIYVSFLLSFMSNKLSYIIRDDPRRRLAGGSGVIANSSVKSGGGGVRGPPL